MEEREQLPEPGDKELCRVEHWSGAVTVSRGTSGRIGVGGWGNRYSKLTLHLLFPFSYQLWIYPMRGQGSVLMRPYRLISPGTSRVKKGREWIWRATAMNKKLFGAL